jgi:hypothetical protein
MNLFDYEVHKIICLFNEVYHKIQLQIIEIIKHLFTYGIDIEVLDNLVDIDIDSLIGNYHHFDKEDRI